MLPSSSSRATTTFARYSRLTWWTMPVPGGTTRSPLNARLRPAQELVALAVALVLAVDVEGERVGRPVAIDLHRVVDDEVGRDERLDARRVAADVGHRVAHRGEIDDRRNAGEVLQQDARRHERHLGLDRGLGPP